MLGALLYLRLCSLWNRVGSQLRRLRQPKYLAGALVGAAYLYVIYFRPATSGHRRGAPGVPGWDVAPAEVWRISATAGALVVLALFLAMWLLPAENPGLSFTEAEASFLFPAPVSRRSLVHFKLASAQFGVLLQSLFFTLIFNARGLGGPRAAMLLIGWWILLTTVNLHYTAASLSVAQLGRQGVGARRRRAAIGLAVLLTAGAMVLLARGGWHAPQPGDLRTLPGISRYLDENLNRGALHYVLLPFTWVVRPFLAPNAALFRAALPAALLVVAAHYLWVSRLEVAFEEASFHRAARIGALLAARRAGNTGLLRATRTARRAPFALRGPGRPEVALLWKNLLTMPPAFSLRPLLWLALLGGLSLLGHGLMALVLALLLLLFGPVLIRQDLRSDLPQAEILKTYPLAGWQIVLGEMLTPIVVLSAQLWLVLSVGFAVVSWPRFDWVSVPLCATLYVGATCSLPLLTAVLLLVPNAATLLFPGWFEAPGTRGGGIEMLGQRIIFLAGQWLVIMLALLPVAIAGAGLFFILGWLTGPLAALLLALLATLLVLAGEAALGFWWLGWQFEKIDLANEVRP